MALQVWLPLNGDLENQGLANVTTTVNTTVAFNSTGKTGKSYEGNGSRNCKITGFTLGNEATIAIWSKTTTRAKMAWVLECAVSLYLNLYNADIYTLNTGDSNNNPFRDSNNNNITALNDGQWHHFAVTFDGTAAKLYIDGEYRGTSVTYKSPATSSTRNTIKLAGDYGGSHSYDWNGQLNDFRVYDNCLTADEIHELYLGKVVHYHLDDNVWGGTNLWRNSSCRENLTDFNQSTVPFSIVNKDGYQCAHISGATGSTSYLYVPDLMIPDVNGWYTLSADMRLDNYVAGSTNPYVGLYFNGATVNGTWRGVSNRSGDGDSNNGIFASNYNNKGWHRVYITGQYTFAYPSAFRIAAVYARDFTGDLYVKNIKFEKGHYTATQPWVPADGEVIFGSGLGPTGYNLLFDTNAPSLTAVNGPGNRYYESASGGTYSNTFEELTDSPLKEIRYGVRQIVSAVSGHHSVAWYSNGGVPVVVGQPYTMSCYVKVISGTNLTFMHEYGGFSSYETHADTLISDGVWHQYSWTFTPTASCANGGQTRIYPGGLQSVGEILICGWKLEKGTHVTPWQPHLLEMTKDYNRIVKDCSGFKNNLTVRAGEISYSTDTPKYLACQYFNGATALYTHKYSAGWFQYDKCTVMAWMNPTTVPSSFVGSVGFASDAGVTYKGFCICNDAGKFTVYVPNGSWTKLQSDAMPLNEWHHYAATLDGTTVKMYKDGSLVKTSTISWGSAAVPSDGLIQVGVDLPGGDEYYTGYYSDIRLYVTPLSVDDIKKIYEDNTLSERERQSIVYDVDEYFFDTDPDATTYTLPHPPVFGTTITLRYAVDNVSNTYNFTVGTSKTLAMGESTMVYNGNNIFNLDYYVEDPVSPEELWIRDFTYTAWV